MEKMTEQQNDSKFKVPAFDESTIKNIPSAKGYDEKGNVIDLDVWDTWPLQNADGTVAEYNGYQIVFGLAGDPDRGWDTFIYMFYKKLVIIPLMHGKMQEEYLKTAINMLPMILF